MELKITPVFQADDELVETIYNGHPNYLIEYSQKTDPEYCAIYFSSNDLYYPNTPETFTKSIIKKNKFEWYGNRIEKAHKHIFFRDIKKQWYLSGINAEIDSPVKLYEFIKRETKGYKILLIGSSAGGYISVIMGQMLKAERIYSFNGQFELVSLLEKKDTETVNPILYRNRYNLDLLQFYDSKVFITNPGSVYYFQSLKSKWDCEQAQHVEELPINKIGFYTSNHGIPFLKSNLRFVLNMPSEKLNKLSGSSFHPFIFSLKISGFRKTIEGLYPIFIFAINYLKRKTGL